VHLVGFTIETLEVSGVEGKLNTSAVDRVQGRSSDFVAHSHRAVYHWFCGSQCTLGYGGAAARNTGVRAICVYAACHLFIIWRDIISVIWLRGGGGG